MTSDIEREFGALAEKLRRSTVSVHAGRRGSGSGVVWNVNGTIVTNAHVALQRSVEVAFADGRRVRGTVERRDERSDLASIAIEPGDLTAADVRSSRDLRAGELLVAFGHPLGVSNVLTTGIAYAGHSPHGDRFVRADLRLAPGNSGGPLADADGRVVGINSMYAGGLALAVPSDEVVRFLAASNVRPRLGVQLTPARTRDNSLVYVVTSIERSSAAEHSGVLPGDIMSPDAVPSLGSAATVDVIRGGKPLTITITRASGESSAAA